jgi:hypothetical protein
MKDWTIMVYMAGDNNLSENMAFSLEGIGQASAAMGARNQQNVNLLTYFDGASLTAPTMYIDYSELGHGEEAFRRPLVSSATIRSGNSIDICQ